MLSATMTSQPAIDLNLAGSVRKSRRSRPFVSFLGRKKTSEEPQIWSQYRCHVETAGRRPCLISVFRLTQPCKGKANGYLSGLKKNQQLSSYLKGASCPHRHLRRRGEKFATFSLRQLDLVGDALVHADVVGITGGGSDVVSGRGGRRDARGGQEGVVEQRVVKKMVLAEPLVGLGAR